MRDGHDNSGTPPDGEETFPHWSDSLESDEAQGPLSPGAQIGKFRVEGQLGRGGMGVVYLARDTELDRFVALKCLPPEVRRNEAMQSRLRREARLLAKLNHPNIATLFQGPEEAEGIIYLVLEYIAGQNLAAHIRGGRLSLAEALSIATQTATAVAAAHAHGIIHRDLKPGNIMITPLGHVKVLDFGLGRAMDMETMGSKSPPTRPGWPMGTVAYMSPELAMGRPADYRTDIWSLGVVVYEMLTGDLPFGGDSEPAILHATVHDPPRDMREWREAIPDALEQAVLKMLRKEPSGRHANMDLVVGELTSLSQSGGGPIVAGGETASIAVLPFVDLSPNRDQEYFCDGIAEELINALTRIPNLRVIARTSAFSYKGRNISVRQIGRELNVSTILEGSVRWADDRLRVTAQLIDVKHDCHLWSERYDRPRGDIFCIQDDITSAIVNRLKLTLADQEKARSVGGRPANLDAYHLYLLGCYFRSKGTPGTVHKAFEYFQQAIEHDPNYALPYVGLALSYSLLPFYSLSPPMQTVPKAREMVAKALQIDPMLPDAHGALGFIKTWYEWDWAGAQREIRLAIELNPGCDRLHLWYAYCLMLQGRCEEARRQVCEALDMDPISVLLNRELGLISYFAGDYDRAVDTLRKTLEMDPSIMYAHAHLAVAYMGKGMYEESLREIQKEREIARGSHTWAETLDGVVRAQMGQRQGAREALDRLLERSRREYISPFHLACIYFTLEQDDEGFEWLSRAYHGQDLWLCFLRALPRFDCIRTDARCIELLRKTNFA
ncbi:MAG: protein kinase [Sedimentisphaerales bacterium]|nr:protein kinase [Sedimentisphaerales bacterium]